MTKTFRLIQTLGLFSSCGKQVFQSYQSAKQIPEIIQCRLLNLKTKLTHSSSSRKMKFKKSMSIKAETLFDFEHTTSTTERKKDRRLPEANFSSNLDFKRSFPKKHVPS